MGLSNTKSGYTYVVGFANDEAQYWGTADSTSSYAWSIYNVLPGTYTLTVYKEELEVYTGSVTITAGAGTAVHTIACDDPEDDTAIWRIGDWDGTPAGFLNFVDTPMKPTYMHPVSEPILAFMMPIKPSTVLTTSTVRQSSVKLGPVELHRGDINSQ